MGISGKVFNYSGTAGATCRMTMLALALVSCSAAEAPAVAPSEAPPATSEGRWDAGRIDQLLRWARTAPEDALPCPDTRAVAAAQASGDPSALDQAADRLALELARMHLLGIARPAERAGWRIADTDGSLDLESRLKQAVEAGSLDAFFDGLRPKHSDYAALRQAYAAEKDGKRRQTIALNLERWRWMPHSLGTTYVLVNTASFEARFWRDGNPSGNWRVIVGKPSTPSPVFAARISGVTFNPWWDIPPSIIREKGARFPGSQGYVRTANGYRQAPGPRNALGQMKLVMPNPFSVYLHDTPSKSLFARDSRAFSHGCIRVGNPMDLAATLLHGTRTRAQVDALVATGQTVTIALPASVPVYVTYFTAAVRADGSFAIMPDIYGRDRGMDQPPSGFGTECSGATPQGVAPGQ